MLEYFFHPAAEKELHRLPLKIHRQIIEKIKELCRFNHPLQHPKVKKLKGRKFEEYRLRVGDYRVKFIFIKPNIIKITHVQHRGVGY
jgi:mRNA-degrading endonuclease RelE of RelBE toxin-antitoxin system